MKTIIDKLNLIRKILSLIQLFLCIVVFAFGLIVLIIGCVALATANRDVNSFFTNSDFVSGANLLITAGLFSFIIAAIGLVGSVPGLFDRQDNWNLWIAIIADCVYLAILLLVIIFQIAAGAWAYAKWDYASSVLTQEIIEEISVRYGQEGSELFTEQIDNFQIENKCCGFDNYLDWKDSDWRINNSTRFMNRELPLSCCGVK
uniref:tetraspanin family protein n=1 Tax=Salmonella sp. s51228 TaxID=3159652 RepID=UPI003980366E